MIAVAIVGSDRKHAEGILSRIAEMASGHRDMVAIDSNIEWF